MSAELINIKVFTYTGVVDTSLSPVIDIYNTTDSASEVIAWSMIFNSTLGRYQFLFTNFDRNKEYVCDVDCWVWAMTRYLSFGIGDVNWAGLHKWDTILNLEEISIVI